MIIAQNQIGEQKNYFLMKLESGGKIGLIIRPLIGVQNFLVLLFNHHLLEMIANRMQKNEPTKLALMLVGTERTMK